VVALEQHQLSDGLGGNHQRLGLAHLLAQKRKQLKVIVGVFEALAQMGLVFGHWAKVAQKLAVETLNLASLFAAALLFQPSRQLVFGRGVAVFGEGVGQFEGGIPEVGFSLKPRMRIRLRSEWLESADNEW
jgi:hypothetical protein